MVKFYHRLDHFYSEMNEDNPLCITPITCSTNRNKSELRFMLLYNINELFVDFECY